MRRGFFVYILLEGISEETPPDELINKIQIIEETTLNIVEDLDKLRSGKVIDLNKYKAFIGFFLIQSEDKSFKI